MARDNVKVTGIVAKFLYVSVPTERGDIEVVCDTRRFADLKGNVWHYARPRLDKVGDKLAFNEVNYLWDKIEEYLGNHTERVLPGDAVRAMINAGVEL